MRVRKIIAGTALGVAAFSGGIVGAVGLSPITAMAQDAVDEAQRPGDWFGSVLSDLVGEGEITQEQADLIETRVEEARPERSHGFGKVRGLKGSLDDLSAALDTTPADLFTALRDGESLGDIAAEQGVGNDELIEILTEDHFAKLDEKVASGDIDAADAEAHKAEATERIQAMIDGDLEAAFGGHGRHGFGMRGHGQRGFGS